MWAIWVHSPPSPPPPPIPPLGACGHRNALLRFEITPGGPPHEGRIPVPHDV